MPMIPEKIAQIRAAIAEEKARCDNTSDFNYWMLEKAVKIHRLVALPESEEFEALATFVESYIDFLPDCLAHFNRVAHQANLNEYTDLFLNLAMDFVLAPPNELELEVGFGHLIDEAYMAHRILEELNDRCMPFLGGPGMPADTAIANVIVHSLIGDDFANELDMAVHFAIESQSQKEQQVKSNLQPVPSQMVANAAKDWPVLGEDLMVGLNFRF